MQLLVSNFWQLFVLSAPWLMLGLLIAGLINVYLPKDFLIKHLGSDGLLTTIKAALIGAPMPLCSCGVIPAALALRRAGASKSATTAFLVSTPETGIDSISVSYVLLGPFMAIIRPIAAITSAIVAGVLVGRDSKDELVQHEAKNNDSSCCADKEAKPDVIVAETSEQTSCCAKPTAATKTSCCASEAKLATDAALPPESQLALQQEPQQKVSKASADTCCSTKGDEHDSAQGSVFNKLKQALAFSCTKLLNDTAKWLIIGLAFAALVQTYIPLSFFSQWGSGLLAMIVVILISIPMYVCATASTPIAAGLLLSGVSPGAVLVFMLAGPATNIATLGVVASELGKRAVASYLTGVIGVAIAFGFLTDMLVEHFDIEVAPMLGEHHEVLPNWLSQSFALILVLLLVRLLVLKFAPKRQALKS
ncbi:MULTISPECIES: SO_0444 family Cu/Zn efflux transporter [Colwellia]|uniref:Permease n=1 Tax=Colwellia marinimaniae TaxID=1513592 RepID=A0ABQ0MVW9_9GAMM|nr:MULTISPECIES: SO_0444 family Cu/Zn efflux transporter [Colwellia]GAW96515.1 permease [Colwellia marinimaniae]